MQMSRMMLCRCRTGTTMTLLLFLGELAFMQADASAQRTSGRLSVYVADFQTETKVDGNLLRGVTDDFETLLFSSDTYTVLERRKVATLMGQVKNEEDLTRNPALVAQLRKNGAQAVFLGHVEEDVDDGSLVFYVSLIELNGTIRWKRDAVVRKTLIHDRESRRDALRAIVTVSVSERADSPPGPRVGGRPEDPFKRAILGAWFSKDDEHSTDPRGTVVRMVSTSLDEFLRNGDFNTAGNIQIAVAESGNVKEIICFGVVTGQWELNGRTLTERIRGSNFQLLGAMSNGVELTPELAKTQGYSCDLLSSLLVPGFSMEEEIIDIDGETMRTRKTGGDGTPTISIYTRKKP